MSNLKGISIDFIKFLICLKGSDFLIKLLIWYLVICAFHVISGVIFTLCKSVYQLFKSWEEVGIRFGIYLLLSEKSKNIFFMFAFVIPNDYNLSSQ